MPPNAAPRFGSAPDAYAWLDARIDYEARLDQAAYGDFAASLSAFRGRLGRLGDPQRGLRTIHIAGTRGKGSAALALEALLRASGLRTATFTSPHLTEYRERIRIDGAPVSGDFFAEGLARLAAAELATPCNGSEAAPEPHSHAFKTVFETLTALFFMLARDAGVDWLVIETGLGGRLDATNAIDPGPVLWTRIGLDHTYLLGTTVEAIAREKAAILKPGGWAVMGAQEHPDAVAVFEAQARGAGAPLSPAELLCPLRGVEASPGGLRVALDFEGRPWDLTLSLLGLFQAANLQSALAMLAELRRRGEIPPAPDAALQSALANLVLPARMSLFRTEGFDLIVDGAHCPTGARALAESMAAHFGGEPALLCAAMMRDKDHEDFFRELAAWPGWSEVWCYQASSQRSLPSEALAEAARRHFPRVRTYQNMEQVLEALAQSADLRYTDLAVREHGFRRAAAAGSFYTAARFSAWGEEYVRASRTWQ